MSVTRLAAKVVDCHVLDVARLLEGDGVDLLRRAANASAAGTDWYLARPILRWRRAALVVHVGDVSLIGPFDVACALEWRSLRWRHRRGQVLIRAIATSLGDRPTTEVTLAAVHRRCGVKIDSRTRVNAAQHFINSLGAQLQLEQALASR